MKTGLTASLVAHAALITTALIGLHSVAPFEPAEIEAISVDLVPIEEIASIRTGSEQSKVIDTPAPAVVDTPDPAQLAERTGVTEKDQPQPEETTRVTPAPTVQTAPEPVPTPTPTPTEEPKPEPQPAPAVEKLPEPAPQPTAPEPVLTAAPSDATPQDVAPKPILKTASLDKLRAEYKANQKAEQKKTKPKENAKPADKVADIINTEQSRGATTGSGGQQSAGKPSGQAARLTQSELGALIAQMRKCWSPTLQERNDGVVVRLMVAMNRDGTVAGQPQITSDTTDPMLGLSARTAARKVQNCGPFNLPSDKYDHWREIDVTLDASQE